MRKIKIIILSLILAGCGSTIPLVKQELPVVKETQYVVRIPPKELLTIPPVVTPIDPDSSTQADVAGWIILNDARSKALQNQLIGIGQFFKVQQDQLDAQAAQENAKAHDDAAAQLAASASSAAARPADTTLGDNLKQLETNKKK